MLDIHAQALPPRGSSFNHAPAPMNADLRPIKVRAKAPNERIPSCPKPPRTNPAGAGPVLAWKRLLSAAREDESGEAEANHPFQRANYCRLDAPRIASIMAWPRSCST